MAEQPRGRLSPLPSQSRAPVQDSSCRRRVPTEGMDEIIRPAKMRRTAATTIEETQKETSYPVSREHIPSPRSSLRALHDETIVHPRSSTPSSRGSPNLACELHVGDCWRSPATSTSKETIAISSSNGKEKIDKVQKLVRGLCSAYTSQEEPQHATSSSQQIPNVRSVNNDPWTEWYQKVRNDLRTRRSTELDRYLDEDPVPDEEIDIINWWMSNASKYPTLSCIARDLLAVPASSVPSESAFSIARRIINDFRSSLTPETVEALICTQDWYRAEAEGSTKFSTAAVDDLIMEEKKEQNSQA